MRYETPLHSHLETTRSLGTFAYYVLLGFKLSRLNILNKNK